jgi:hypothetical protein
VVKVVGTVDSISSDDVAKRQRRDVSQIGIEDVANSSFPLPREPVYTSGADER